MLLALAVGASAALVVPTVLAALVLSGGQMR